MPFVNLGVLPKKPSFGEALGAGFSAGAVKGVDESAEREQGMAKTLVDMYYSTKPELRANIYGKNPNWHKKAVPLLNKYGYLTDESGMLPEVMPTLEQEKARAFGGLTSGQKANVLGVEPEAAYPEDEYSTIAGRRARGQYPMLELGPEARESLLEMRKKETEAGVPEHVRAESVARLERVRKLLPEEVAETEARTGLLEAQRDKTNAEIDVLRTELVALETGGTEEQRKADLDVYKEFNDIYNTFLTKADDPTVSFGLLMRKLQGLKAKATDSIIALNDPNSSYSAAIAVNIVRTHLNLLNSAFGAGKKSPEVQREVYEDTLALVTELASFFPPDSPLAKVMAGLFNEVYLSLPNELAEEYPDILEMQQLLLQGGSSEVTNAPGTN